MSADRDDLGALLGIAYYKLCRAVSVLSDGTDSAGRAEQLDRLHWLATELDELHQDVMHVLAELGTGPGVTGGR